MGAYEQSRPFRESPQAGGSFFLKAVPSAFPFLIDVKTDALRFSVGPIACRCRNPATFRTGGKEAFTNHPGWVPFLEIFRALAAFWHPIESILFKPVFDHRFPGKPVAIKSPDRDRRDWGGGRQVPCLLLSGKN